MTEGVSLAQRANRAHQRNYFAGIERAMQKSSHAA